ncbi:hypothetical protein Lalb_Chr23g0276341 [Lupinus albus]|uniref:Uncharacterized protein n=1 Tax=Lupinus albus TaxID=3870 RepID=A0A6A4N9Z7_LUPAL|nr:hypothetical protein Lalb_Chr23g0276341 [Lupinus albus]
MLEARVGMDRCCLERLRLSEKVLVCREKWCVMMMFGEYDFVCVVGENRIGDCVFLRMYISKNRG